MREMIVCEKKIRTDNGEKLTLIYSVTIDELSDKSMVVESYGAAIAVQELGEQARVRHITHRDSEIFELTSLLSSNDVTPAILADVVDDWLCR